MRRPSPTASCSAPSLVALLTGAVCAVLSCYLVLKGWSLMGDAVSHAVLPGIVLAFVLGLPLAVGAFAAGLFCAVATGYLKDNSRVKEDTVMGIVFSGMFGLGLVLFTKVETDQHLLHVLFGNMLGVTTRDLSRRRSSPASRSAVVLAKRRDLLLYCFDPEARPRRRPQGGVAPLRPAGAAVAHHRRLPQGGRRDPGGGDAGGAGGHRLPRHPALRAHARSSPPRWRSPRACSAPSSASTSTARRGPASS